MTPRCPWHWTPSGAYAQHAAGTDYGISTARALDTDTGELPLWYIAWCSLPPIPGDHHRPMPRRIAQFRGGCEPEDPASRSARTQARAACFADHRAASAQAEPA